MRLEENTCGPTAVFLQEGERFSAELRTDREKAYWRVPEQPVLHGTYEGERFQFSFTSPVASSDPDAGTPLCQLLQTVNLEGSVETESEWPDSGAFEASAPKTARADAGAAPERRLRAGYTLTIGPAPGTDCTQAVAPVGAFLKLPCVVRYTLRGEERESFD